MKHVTAFLLLTLMTLISVSCDQVKSTKSKTTNIDCTLAPYTLGCPANPYTGTTTGTTTGAVCTNPQVGQQYQCTNYCQFYPNTSGCIVVSGSYVNCNTSPSTAGCPASSPAINKNYAVKYPGGTPQGSCSDPYAANGETLGVRKGTVTVVGGQWYNPSSASSLYNTSSMLKSVNNAKTYFMTDSVLKIRFKANPQPDAAGTTGTCYNRATGSSLAGYTKMSFGAKVVGYKANNSMGEEPLGYFTIGVNSCTPAINLSQYKAQYPNGIYVVIFDVKGNHGMYPANYNTMGFTDSSSFAIIRSQDCWTMDLEVAADGTQTFN